MPEINAVITNAGLKKMLTDGISQQLDYIVLGEGKYIPHKNQEKLKNPKLKVDNVILNFNQDNYITLTCRTDAEVNVMVSEIGIFTKDNLLFAIWADKEPCFFKGKYERVRYTINLVLTDEKSLKISSPLSSQTTDFTPEKEDMDYSLLLSQLNMGIAQIQNARAASNNERVTL